MTNRGNNVEWLDSVSLTSIINISIGSGGSGWISRIWQSQYGTLDMSRYNVMWCYMLSTLTNDRIKKKNSRHCHIDFIALKEITRGGGGHKWHSLYGWLGARKTCPSALAMELRLSFTIQGICLGMRPAHERRLYTVTTSLIGWAHTYTDPCWQWVSSISHVDQYSVHT